MTAVPLTQPSLLVRLRDLGDQEAWVRFVGLYTPLVYGFARKRGLQQADAGDLAQVMRAVAAGAGRFEYDHERGSFRGWLYTVTCNKFNDFVPAHGAWSWQRGYGHA